MQRSLADEIRAIRNGGDSKMLFKHTHDPGENERPWQEDLDSLRRTLQEVLAAVSRLSGIELPGAEPNAQNPEETPPQLANKTLKERIRNDLEAFSVKTASELIRDAEGQMRAALAEMQHEISERAQGVATEYEEKMQGRVDPGQIEIHLAQETRDRVTELVRTRTEEFARWVWLMCKGADAPIPVQIRKLLEPYVEDAMEGFTASVRLRIQDQLAEHEQLIENRFQAAKGSFESEIGALEQAAQQICERNADEVTRVSADRLNQSADEAASSFDSKIREKSESSFFDFQTRLEETAATHRENLQAEADQIVEAFRQKIAGLASEVDERKLSEISERVERLAADVVESSFQHLQHQAGDTLQHSKEELQEHVDLQMEEVRLKVSELGQSVHESLSQDAEQMADRLKQFDQEINIIRDKHIAASEERFSSVVHGSVESLREGINDLVANQLEKVDQVVKESQEKAASQYESQLRDATEERYQSVLDRIEKETGEAGARVMSEVRADSESVIQEITQKVNTSATVLREQAMQATAQIESSLKSSLETYREQLAQITGAGLEEHRQAMQRSLSELQKGFERSAQALRRESSGDPETTQ